MSFVLEVSKKGKDTILFKNHRYREAYPVKSGDIVWRCLGKACKASIRTNPEKTTIYSASETHSGPHPVTLRSLTPTPPRRSCPPTTTTAPTSTPVSRLTPENSPTPSAHPIQSTPSPPLDLLSENTTLKEELVELRKELQVILNHSVESDQRLLQYTDSIFLPPTSMSTFTHPGPSRTSESKSTQCAEDELLLPTSLAKENNDLVHSRNHTNDELRKQLKHAEEKIMNLETLVASINKPCDRCKILKEETEKMLSSIRCLELEIKCLKDSCSGPTRQITHSNRFEVLSEDNSEDGRNDSAWIVVPEKKREKSTKKRKTNKKKNNKNVTTGNTKASISFSNLTIVGDSHVRHLPSIIKDLVQPTTRVSGVCKPGAGLLNIAPTSAPPPNNCYVIMAGSNDVGSGRQSNIFGYLESILQKCRASSDVLLVPLPPRHDIPTNSPIHQTVWMVNGFMAELCERYNGVSMLDVTGISRQHFTSHGLHLRASGKRLLANLIVKKLAQCTPAPQPSTRPSPSMSTRPHFQDYESYAAAVSGTSSPAYSAQTPAGLNQTACEQNVEHKQTDNEIQTGLQHNVFLGPPLPRNGLKLQI